MVLYQGLFSQANLERVVREDSSQTIKMIESSDELRNLRDYILRTTERLTSRRVGSYQLCDQGIFAILALLGQYVEEAKVLDVGCGTITEPKPVKFCFPPLFAEALQDGGALVTGLDIRENPYASYHHHVVDVAQPSWTTEVDGGYDFVRCFSLFDDPDAPFTGNEEKIKGLIRQTREVLFPDGVLCTDRPLRLLRSSGEEIASYFAECGYEVISHSRNLIFSRAA